MRVITVAVQIMVPKNVSDETIREYVGQLVAEDLADNETLVSVDITSVRKAVAADYPEE